MNRFVALIFLAAFLSSCSKPGAVNVSLSSAEAQALQDAFARLDRALAEKAPAIYTNLAPPAAEADIAALHAALNGSTNAVLEAWFRWHNGWTNGYISLLPLGTPISIAEALEDRKMIQSIPFMDKVRRRSLKILDDGAGDGFFIDLTATKPVVFYQMLEEPSLHSYGTLTELVEFVASGFERGVFFVDGQGQFDYDEKAYEEMQSQHVRWLR
jgi:hypothetical protein